MIDSSGSWNSLWFSQEQTYFMVLKHNHFILNDCENSFQEQG